MDALEFLKEDHQKVKRLFKQIAETDDPSKRQELFDQIDTELEIHAHIEETVFYPALENYDQLIDMVADARDEHQTVKALLEELEELGVESGKFVEELTVLMFPAVRDILDASTLEDLGKQLASAKGKPQHDVDVETFGTNDS
jgi:hemerythrin superfamily protein